MLLRMLPLLALFSVQTLNIPSAFAQFRSRNEPAEIRGQLRYAQGGAPAADVVVRLDQLTGGFVAEVRTDRLGKFRFSNLSPIQYHLIVRHPGYQELFREVNLIMTGSEYLQLQLHSNEPASAKIKHSTGVLDANVPAAARKEFEKGEERVATGKRDKIEEAVLYFERAIALYPQFVEARLRLGTTHMDLGQWDKAEQVLRKTLEINSKAVNALFALGELYLWQKKYNEAEKVLLQGLAMEDRSYQGHLALARVYWDTAIKIKDETQSRPVLEKSYEQVKKALELNPNLADAHLLKGNLLFRVRRAPDALHEFEEYLRLEPNGQFAGETRALVDKIKKALESTRKD
jgi:tetratricopeptide (TPR) repeat protein